MVLVKDVVVINFLVINGRKLPYDDCTQPVAAWSIPAPCRPRYAKQEQPSIAIPASNTRESSKRFPTPYTR